MQSDESKAKMVIKRYICNFLEPQVYFFNIEKPLVNGRTNIDGRRVDKFLDFVDVSRLIDIQGRFLEYCIFYFSILPEGVFVGMLVKVNFRDEVKLILFYTLFCLWIG